MDTWLDTLLREDMCLYGDRTHLYILKALLGLVGRIIVHDTFGGEEHVGKGYRVDVGAGEQSIWLWLGYVSEDAMPLSHSLATRLGKT